MTVTLDPIWPWSQLFNGDSDSSFLGGLLSRGETSLLVLVPALLIVLTAWTYLGSGQSRRRALAVLLLRLLAFALVVAVILRPSFGVVDRHAQRSVLLVVADNSESMAILDEIDSQSRWAYLLKLLKDSGASIDALQDEQNVDVVLYRFAGDTTTLSLDDPGQADGKRTDIGSMLRQLYENRDGQRRLLGLLVLSDGADNGTRVPALTEAVRWRNLPCPVHTFAFGKTTTSDRRSDIIVTAITSQPAPVPVKSLLTVKATIDAPGFENRLVNVKLFIEGKQVQAKDERLSLTLGNEVRLTTNAPDKPGEIKVTVRVDDPTRPGQPLEGELTGTNNEISTYVTVSKEGMRVLLVDKPRDGEPQAISDALSRDARIRVSHVWLRGGEPAGPDVAELLDCDKNAYDVIILGDVTAKQLGTTAVNSMVKAVGQGGTGFLMMGGYSTFGNGDWAGSRLADLMPVKLKPGGQIEGRPVRMVPTDDGLRRFGFMLRLTDKAGDARTAWQALKPLDGMTLLGDPSDEQGLVLARADDAKTGPPLLVTKQFGQGRVLAFGGDTTNRWIRSPETLEMFRRFWQRLALWLAKQDEAEGSVWVLPDTRRLPIRSDLGFSVGMKSKTGAPIFNGVYKAEVLGPNGSQTPVSTARSGNDQRGAFTKADVAGEYRIHVTGEGKDENGDEVKGEATVRFLVYDEDIEMQRRAADHDFLRKLATAGGGKFHQGDELPGYLRELLNQRGDPSMRPKLKRYPNWSPERAKGPSPFLSLFFVLFVLVVSGEWWLRRHWGLV